MENKKYKLTDETINLNGVTLYRIEALKDFGEIKKGDKGGFIESEKNLTHDGNAWVSGNACVYNNACVSDNACVYGDCYIYDSADIYGNAKVCDNANVYDNAKVYGNACVYGDACVYDSACVSDNVWVSGSAHVYGYVFVYGYAHLSGNAEISNKFDYIVFQNWWSSGRYFTWTRSNNMWSVGCFYGTGEELIKKAYEDSELSGREYSRVVKYVEGILGEENLSNNS